MVVPAAGVEYRMNIYVDGDEAFWYRNRDVTQSVVATSGRSSIGEMYQTAAQTFMNVRIPVTFRRNVEVRLFQNTGGAVLSEAYLYANVVR